MLNESNIKEFQEIYLELYGEQLSKQKAAKYSQDLLRFYKLFQTPGGCHENKGCRKAKIN